LNRKPVFLFGIVFLFLSLGLTACTVKPSMNVPTLTAKVTQVMPTNTPAPTPTSACLSKGGQTMQEKIDSVEMGETLTFTIYLPPCYDVQHSGGYPVLYLFHGQNMDDTFWPSLGVTGGADQAIRAGHTPFIMVFPYEVHNWDLPSESKFGDAVMKDLIPWVESHYSVCTARQCQAIGGLSRGGGWAMHIALTNFGTFGSVGAHSFGYFSGDLYRVENLLKKYTPADFPRIYIDRGKDDYLRDNIDLYEKNLTYTEVVHEYVVNPGLHNKAYWQSQVQTYLNWYMQGFDNLNP
jgi:enterochelin esterase-like enzyme